MSTPPILEGAYVVVLIETTVGGGAFTPLCGMITRTFTDRVNVRDRFLRDCTDPTAIPTRTTIATGEQWDLSASGIYNRAQAVLIGAAMGKIRLYRFAIGEPDDDAIYQSYWEGSARMTQRQIGGNDNDDASSELTFASQGAWVEHVGDGLTA